MITATQATRQLPQTSAIKATRPSNAATVWEARTGSGFPSSLLYHSQPHRQCTQSLNLSFLSTALHTGHNRIHIFPLSDALWPSVFAGATVYGKRSPVRHDGPPFTAPTVTKRPTVICSYKVPDSKRSLATVKELSFYMSRFETKTTQSRVNSVAGSRPAVIGWIRVWRTQFPAPENAGATPRGAATGRSCRVKGFIRHARPFCSKTMD